MVQYASTKMSRFLEISAICTTGQERSAKTAAYLAAQMHRFAQARGAGVYIKGNHECGKTPSRGRD